MGRPRKLPSLTVLGLAPLDIPTHIAAIIIFPNLRVVKIMSKICPKGALRNDLAAFSEAGREFGSLQARLLIPRELTCSRSRAGALTRGR